MTEPLLLMPGEHVRLTKDEVLNLDDLVYGKWQLSQALGNSQWPIPPMNAVFPAGTVFQVGSYRITNNTNPRYNKIGLLVVHSDEKQYLPKSRGGTGRRVILYLPVTTHFMKWSFERAHRNS